VELEVQLMAFKFKWSCSRVSQKEDRRFIAVQDIDVNNLEAAGLGHVAQVLCRCWGNFEPSPMVEEISLDVCDHLTIEGESAGKSKTS
jgi:hypothetical protein